MKEKILQTLFELCHEESPSNGYTAYGIYLAMNDDSLPVTQEILNSMVAYLNQLYKEGKVVKRGPRKRDKWLRTCWAHSDAAKLTEGVW